MTSYHHAGKTYDSASAQPYERTCLALVLDEFRPSLEIGVSIGTAGLMMTLPGLIADAHFFVGWSP